MTPDSRVAHRPPDLDDALTRLDRALAAEREIRDIPGLSVAAVLGGDVIWAKGYGWADLERQITATPDTIYRVASITKLFTATMLMQLRDAGLLQLDEPAATHVPAFVVSSPFPDSRPPTFRQLASHTSGLPQEAPLSYFQTLRFPAIDAILDSLKDTAMVFPAMSEYKYSNLGYAILGHVLEVVAGKPYTQYVREHILDPLGMRQSGYAVTAGMEVLAAGYSGARERLGEGAIPSDLGAFVPAGGLYSSAAEMARFIALQFREGPAGGEQILGGTSLREMRAPVLMDLDWQAGSAIGWALGRVAGQGAIDHRGGMPGFTSDVTLIPHLKLGVAVFANARTEPWEISRTSLEILLPYAEEESRRRTLSVTKASTPLERYTGRYIVSDRSSARGLAFHIALAGGVLIGSFAGASAEAALTFVPEGEHSFRLQSAQRTELNGERASFRLDEERRVISFRLGSYLLRPEPVDSPASRGG